MMSGVARPSRESQRLRVPQPLIRRRLPSGRGAMEQPNSTGDGDTALTPAFWVAVVITGVAAGLFGAGLMAILYAVQHLAFDYHSGAMLGAIERLDDVRRLIPLLIAGALGGPAWYLLRTHTKNQSSDIDEAIWSGEGQLSVPRSLGTSLISIGVVGAGASIGREAAPKLMGGVSGSIIAGWFGLSPAQRKLLVACGGGAGLAAVYNVPLGGALFTAEILCASVVLPTILPALVCSCVATATAWIYLPEHATYLAVPAYHVSGTILVWAVLAGPIIGLLAAGYVRAIGWVAFHRVKGRLTIVAPLVAFAIIGVVGFRYPQVFGNGKDMAHDVFLGAGTLGLLFALALLKPLMTALCLGSNVSGGLFTPTLSTGAVLGGALGLAWTHLWPGSPVGAFAMVGAAAMIGASMQAPLTGLALVLELTHSGFELMVPMMAATALATLVTRLIDGYSIYTARLPADVRPTPPI
jgi:chloride channel protein, CIC family